MCNVEVSVLSIQNYRNYFLVFREILCMYRDVGRNETIWVRREDDDGSITLLRWRSDKAKYIHSDCLKSKDSRGKVYIYCLGWETLHLWCICFVLLETNVCIYVHLYYGYFYSITSVYGAQYPPRQEPVPVRYFHSQIVIRLNCIEWTPFFWVFCYQIDPAN